MCQDGISPPFYLLFTMSARGTRTLSRLFQATMKMLPEKKHSDAMEDTIPTVSDKDLVFGLDPPSKEQETIWYYNSKLVFKDGKFLVRALSIS